MIKKATLNTLNITMSAALEFDFQACVNILLLVSFYFWTV